MEPALLALTLIWIAGGLPVLVAMAWTAGGRRETILVAGERLTIIRPVGPFRRTRAFDGQSIRHLRAVRAFRPFLADVFACREFWLGGSGPIRFQYGGRQYAFGSALNTASAARLVSDLSAMLPLASGAADVPAMPTRARRYALAYVATALLIPAFTVPVRLTVTDRSICFCEDPAPLPASPVKVREVASSASRIALVPLDGYSPERARAIADHFREQFGVRIRVEPGIPASAGAYDVTRRQMSAAALLAVLEDRYADSAGRVVVIGLTDADMYIPDEGSRHAFSYRRGNRVAVVSSARLDVGCLGLFPADEDRQLARVRKIVGKHIGLMYFRLPLSRDPRSMLYAGVRGPQELDGMSEAF
jgi:predicted Zn-dependent protease